MGCRDLPELKNKQATAFDFPAVSGAGKTARDKASSCARDGVCIIAKLD